MTPGCKAQTMQKLSPSSSKGPKEEQINQRKTRVWWDKDPNRRLSMMRPQAHRRIGKQDRLTSLSRVYLQALMRQVSSRMKSKTPRRPKGRQLQSRNSPTVQAREERKDAQHAGKRSGHGMHYTSTYGTEGIM